MVDSKVGFPPKAAGRSCGSVFGMGRVKPPTNLMRVFYQDRSSLSRGERAVKTVTSGQWLVAS